MNKNKENLSFSFVVVEDKQWRILLPYVDTVLQRILLLTLGLT